MDAQHTLTPPLQTRIKEDHKRRSRRRRCDENKWNTLYKIVCVLNLFIVSSEEWRWGGSTWKTLKHFPCTSTYLALSLSHSPSRRAALPLSSSQLKSLHIFLFCFYVIVYNVHIFFNIIEEPVSLDIYFCAVWCMINVCCFLSWNIFCKKGSSSWCLQQQKPELSIRKSTDI